MDAGESARCLGRGKGQGNIYLTTVWLSPECQHFYASSESKCLLGDARGHLCEEQIFHESFIPVCLSDLSAVPEPAAAVCPLVAQFFGILSVSVYQPTLITPIYQESVA